MTVPPQREWTPASVGGPSSPARRPSTTRPRPDGATESPTVSDHEHAPVVGPLAPQTPPLGEGSPVAGGRLGKYTLLHFLGRGGMGTVFEAEDALIRRRVAIKILADNLVGDPDALRRFLVEAKSGARVQHPNVVALYSVDTCEGRYFLVMELATGGSSSDLVKEQGPLAWQAAVRITAQAARGLAAAHRARIIHRDIKPANIMLAADGTAKLTDFGLVKLFGEESITRSGVVVGTPAYMSPEQCQGGELTEHSDIYSLGGTLYALLVGRTPYMDAGGGAAVMMAHVADPPPDPRVHRPELPVAVSEVIAKAMAKLPEDRYADADQFATALERLLEPEDAATGGLNAESSSSARAVLHAVAAARKSRSSSRGKAPSRVTPSPAIDNQTVIIGETGRVTSSSRAQIPAARVWMMVAAAVPVAVGLLVAGLMIGRAGAPAAGDKGDGTARRAKDRAPATPDDDAAATRDKPDDSAPPPVSEPADNKTAGPPGTKTGPSTGKTAPNPDPPPPGVEALAGAHARDPVGAGPWSVAGPYPPDGPPSINRIPKPPAGLPDNVVVDIRGRNVGWKRLPTRADGTLEPADLGWEPWSRYAAALPFESSAVAPLFAVMEIRGGAVVRLNGHEVRSVPVTGEEEPHRIAVPIAVVKGTNVLQVELAGDNRAPRLWVAFVDGSGKPPPGLLRAGTPLSARSSMSLPGKAINALTWLPDGRTVAAVAGAGELRLLDAADMAEIGSSPLPTTGWIGAAPFPDSGGVMLCDAAGRLLVTGPGVDTVAGEYGRFPGLGRIRAAEGGRIYAVVHGDTVGVMTGGASKRRMSPPPRRDSTVVDAVFAPKTDRLAVLTFAGDLSIFRYGKDGKPVETHKANLLKGAVGLLWPVENDDVVALYADGRLERWSTATFTLQASARVRGTPTGASAFDLGAYLAIGTAEGRVCLHQVIDLQEHVVIDRFDRPITALSCGVDSWNVAVGTAAPGVVQVFRVSEEVRATAERRSVDLARRLGETAEVFDESPDFVRRLRVQRGGSPLVVNEGALRGRMAMLLPPGAYGDDHLHFKPWPMRARPAAGEYRFVRFAWRAEKPGTAAAVVLVDGRTGKRYRYAAGTVPGTEATVSLAGEVPAKWTVVTRDVVADFGELDAGGLRFEVIGEGGLLVDQFLIGRSEEFPERRAGG